MRHTQIQSALSSLAQERGYMALVTDKEHLDSLVEGFPIAWLKPIELVEKTGRCSGRIKYRIELALADIYSLQPNELANTKLGEMESDMLDILTQLSMEEGVVEVTNICVKPRTSPVTKHKDISQCCTADILCYY